MLTDCSSAGKTYTIRTRLFKSQQHVRKYYGVGAVVGAEVVGWSVGASVGTGGVLLDPPNSTYPAAMSIAVKTKQSTA